MIGTIRSIEHSTITERFGRSFLPASRQNVMSLSVNLWDYAWRFDFVVSMSRRRPLRGRKGGARPRFCKLARWERSGVECGRASLGWMKQGSGLRR